jgi:hypothetical protein
MIQNVYGLTTAEIKKACPSVFSETKAENRSERYRFIPTYEIIDALEDAGFLPTSVMQAKSRKNNFAYAKHLLRFRSIQDLGTTKENTHEIVIINSHNGSSPYKLLNGIFRMICSNGMIVGDYRTSLRVPHKGNIISNIVESTLVKAKESEQILDSVNQMKSIRLSIPEQLYVAEKAMTARFGEIDQSKAIYDASSMLKIHRSEDNLNDLYTTYQILQENGIRGGIKVSSAKNTSRSITNIDKTVQFNTDLWTIVYDFMLTR